MFKLCATSPPANFRQAENQKSVVRFPAILFHCERCPAVLSIPYSGCWSDDLASFHAAGWRSGWGFSKYGGGSVYLCPTCGANERPQDCEPRRDTEALVNRLELEKITEDL
jgi:hypothetical protein